MFEIQQVRVVKFCAEACERQKSGEISVFNMLRAFNFAFRYSSNSLPFQKRITVSFIEELGRLIEPEKNDDGFRTENVYKHDPNALEASNLLVPIGSFFPDVPRHIRLLISSYYEGKLSVEEFYKAFEEVHPFVDGNGRTGEILYNFLLERMTQPIAPPDFWGQKGEGK